MFLVLFGVVTCVDTLCLKTSSGSECPTGIDPSNQFDTVAPLLAKILNKGTILYLAADLTAAADKIPDAKISLISEIISVKASDAIVAVSYELSSEVTIDSLTLTKVTLTAAASASVSKLLLDGAKKLTFTTLVLKEGSSVTASSPISIVTLVSDSLTSAKDAIPLTTQEVSIVGDNAIKTITADTNGIKLTGAQTADTEVEIAGTVQAVININSRVTADLALSVTGVFTALEVTVNVNLIYGNEGKAIATIDSADGAAVSSKLKIKVDTYYTLGDKFTLVASMFTLDTKYVMKTGGKRTVPAAAEYCLDKDNKRKAYCPADAQVLWDATEFVEISNDNNLIVVYIGTYTADAANIGLIKNMKTMNVRLLGDKGTTASPTVQKIKIGFEKAGEAVEGDFQFENIDLNVEVPTGTTAATLSCKKLLVDNSKLAVSAAVAGASRNLKIVPTIVVSSVDLIADAKSIGEFDLKKPTNSFSIINLKKAEFAGDGTSVKFDEVAKPFTNEEILIPFKIIIPSNETIAAANPLELKVVKDATKGTSTALPFSIDVQSGAELNVKYEGDWSSNKVIVNVAKGGKFIGKTEGTDAKEPTMELQGEGTATINGKDVPRPVVPAAPTDSNKLSGGAIAGIVIACVVVVAAVVVGVVIVLKKKKGKVAN